MKDIKGFYQPKHKEANSRTPVVAVRAIWFPSFEHEVVVEDHSGVLSCWSVDKFLSQHDKTEQKFKPKLERVKDNTGQGKYEQHGENGNRAK